MAQKIPVEPYYNILEDPLMQGVLWHGIVAPRDSWSTNTQEEGITSPQQLENWGKRVKVRIKGIHPPDKKLLPDDQLPWAEVCLPATGGSGHGGATAIGGITSGSQVFGVWTDSILKTGPLILGTRGQNDEIPLARTQPDNNGFLAYSGYTSKDSVAGYNIPLIQGLPLEGGWNSNLWGLSDKAMMQEFTFGIASPTDCEKIPLNGIMKSMQELIQSVEKAQKQLTEWQQAAQGWIADKQAWIQEKTKKAQEFISKGIKWVFKEIRKYIEEQINKQTKKLYENINPPDRDKAKVGHDALMELITCLFNKLIKNLFKMVGNFLNQIFDRYINVPACAIQNFMADLIGNTIGKIAGAIDSIISSVSGLIGGVFSLANSILNLLKALAGFFACEEDQECPETKEWNIFEGGKPSAVFDIDSIIGSAQGIASQAMSLVSGATGLVDTIATAVNFDDLINSAISATSGCNIGPVFCGTPKVTFWGGGGSGALGNVIVSAAGDILGVDVISRGLGYTKAPFVDISDNCGKGSGVSATAIMTPDGGTDPNTGLPTQQVINVVINNPGGDYPTRPNGDLGGDGRVWAPAENTVIRTSDGRWEQYPPGSELPQRDGDIIITPEDRQILTGGVPIGPGGLVTPGFGLDNDAGQSIENQIANARGITRIPGTGPNGATEFDAFPVINIGSYPAILYLCDLQIESAGINYSPGDQVVIEPNLGGAEIEVTFGPFGVVTSARIINSGSGFTERPEIYIKSETGYNAKIIPVFCVKRIGDDNVGELTNEQKFKVIRIVDCVGRVD
jgi:Gp5 N-terminal OB domain